MYFTKVKIKNYKSFGSDYNEIILNQRTTTIIGKNESGKSNLLEALSEINFFQKPNFQKKRNKLGPDSVEIDTELEFDKSEISNLGSLTDKVTKASFADGQLCQLEGALVELIYTDHELNSSKSVLSDIINKLDVRGTEFENKKLILNWLSEPLELCQIAPNQQALKLIDHWAIPKINIDDKEIAKRCLDSIIQRLNYFTNLLPNIYIYTPQEYKSRYLLETVSKINNSENINLKNLLHIATITPNQLASAMNNTTDPGLRVIEKNAISAKIQKNITEEFCKYYSFEKVEILLSVENGYFDLLINTDKYPMPFSERSNGLKWYLDLFIQLKSQNLLDKKVLLLIDEPGIQLHIDAQQELLLFLKSLSQSSQIVYTTHSPFMIDTENLSTIRLVERVEGITHIFNKVHSADIDVASKMETLSPLIKALGFSPRYNIGPKYDKLNIIVEGMSDYYYVLGAAIQCGIDLDSFNIIPCIGVSTVHNVASILIGWNCAFKIILDYDLEAFKEINEINKIGLKEQKDYFVYNLERIDRNNMKSKPFNSEDMFEDDDKARFDQGEKHFSSLKFYEMSKLDEIELSKKAKDRFITLFNAIGICNQKS